MIGLTLNLAHMFILGISMTLYAGGLLVSLFFALTMVLNFSGNFDEQLREASLVTNYIFSCGMPSLALYMLCFFFAFFKGLSRPGWFQLPLALCYSITNFLGLRRIWIRTPWVWSSSKGRENWPTWSWMKLFSRIYWSFHLGCISARSHVTEYPPRYDFPDLRWLFLIFLVCIRLSVGFFLFKMYHLALSPRDT